MAKNKCKNASQPDEPVMYSGLYTCIIDTISIEKRKFEKNGKLSYLRQSTTLKEDYVLVN